MHKACCLVSGSCHHSDASCDFWVSLNTLTFPVLNLKVYDEIDGWQVDKAGSRGSIRSLMEVFGAIRVLQRTFTVKYVPAKVLLSQNFRLYIEV